MFGEKIGVNRNEVLRVLGGEALDAEVIRPKQHRLLPFNQPLGRREAQAGLIRETVLGLIGPEGHEPGSGQDDIARSQRRTLFFQRLLQVRHRDGIGGWQLGHVLRLRHIDEHPSGNDRRILVRAGLGPSPNAKSVVGADLIPDLPVQPEVIEGINVGAGVGIHRDAIAGVGQQFLGGVSGRRMRHPNLKRRIPKRTTAGRHPYE